MTYQEVVVSYLELPEVPESYLELREVPESYLALDDDFVIERHGPLSRLYLTSQNR